VIYDGDQTPGLYLLTTFVPRPRNNVNPTRDETTTIDNAGDYIILTVGTIVLSTNVFSQYIYAHGMDFSGERQAR
jgi:hypothetical protein